MDKRDQKLLAKQTRSVSSPAVDFGYIRRELKRTPFHISQSQQVIAETKELMTKVDKLLEDANWMRVSLEELGESQKSERLLPQLGQLMGRFGINFPA